MSRFDDFYRSSPRTARGGIKSQSSRGSFGKSWWARRWIGVLESFDIGGRLGRGKSYARKGQVLSIDIQEGRAKASVQGSRETPYKVEIRVKTIPLQEWQKLSSTAFNQAIVAAKLLAGEMPEDIEMLFTAHGVSLFPKTSDDLKTECSCPDWSNPCKHIAAVYYLLGEEFDRDPFLVFRLRGMSKDRLLELIAGAAEEPEPEVKSTRKSKSASAQSGEVEVRIPASVAANLAPDSAQQAESQSIKPLPIDARSFWKVTLTDGDETGSLKIPVIHASLPKRLGNLPFWRGSESLMQMVEGVYRLASEKAAATLADQDD
jgi:uncharacterized Zn finger protein